MNVTVIGPGAIGLFVALRLLRLGAQVSLVGRAGPQAVRESFLTDEGPLDLNIPACTEQDVARAGLVFVAVKALDLASALSWTRGLRPGTPVVVTVNGAIHPIIVQEKQHSPHLLWHLGSCTFGVSRAPSGRFEQRSSRGVINIGPLTVGEEPAAVEMELVAKDSQVFAWQPHMLALSRRKWLYNTVINTLCAVSRLPCNGDLLRDRPALEGVFNEAYELGIELWGAWTFDREELRRGLTDLIAETRTNENSMARDVRLGRKTESAYLAGLATKPEKYPLLMAYHARIEAFREDRSGRPGDPSVCR